MGRTRGTREEGSAWNTGCGEDTDGAVERRFNECPEHEEWREQRNIASRDCAWNTVNNMTKLRK